MTPSKIILLTFAALTPVDSALSFTATKTSRGGQGRIGYGFIRNVILAADNTPDYPAATDVRDGVSYGTNAYTGNMTLPPENKVESGYGYGAGGTEFTGSLAGGGGGDSPHAWAY